VEEGNRFCQVCGQEVGTAVAPAPSSAGSLPAQDAVSERVSAPLRYAGFWERVAAYLIDGLIIGIPVAIVFLVLIFLFGGFGMMIHRNPADPHAAVAFLVTVIPIFFLGMLAVMILQWLYFAGMESSSRQATFGKSMMSLRVTNLEG
jgi:uncharacterized RDD family membrane protein YckC